MILNGVIALPSLDLEFFLIFLILLIYQLVSLKKINCFLNVKRNSSGFTLNPLIKDIANS